MLLLYSDLDLCFRLLDLVPRHLDFIALSFTIRIVEALGASAATTAAFALTAAVFPDSVATTFVSIFTDLHTEELGPPGTSSDPYRKHFWGTPARAGWLKICTVNRKLSLSYRAIWAWSETVYLYNRATVILLRRTKAYATQKDTVPPSRLPGPGNFIGFPTPSPRQHWELLPCLYSK